ncbi:MAG: hypothetical protein DRJ05_14705 [Bacteroidetes bacterium]|nr:MAG: hypothetical protein DRJ05_14705 [Bacteroidota bacterium]
MEIMINNSNIKLSTDEFIKICNFFSIEDRKQITQSIYNDTLREEWDILDSELPNIDISEEEIISEIRKVRYK